MPRRVGHLLSSFHQLAALCRHAGLRFACCADPASGAARLAPLEGHPLSLSPLGGDEEEGVDGRRELGGVDERAEGNEGMEIEMLDQEGPKKGAEVAEEAATEMDAGINSQRPQRKGYPSDEQYSEPHSKPCGEPVLAALLEEYSEAVELLVEHAKEGGALAGWHFLLDYPQVWLLTVSNQLLVWYNC